MNTEGVRAVIDISATDKGLQEQISKVVKLNQNIQSLALKMSKVAVEQEKLKTQTAKTNQEQAKAALQYAKEKGQIEKNSAAKEQNALKTEKLRLQVEKLQNSNNKSTKSFSLSSFGLFKFASNLGMVANYAKQSAQALQKFFQESADYIETQNLFEVSMSETTAEATKFINTMAEAFNLDDAPLKKATGTFNLLGKQMGLTNDQALIWSQTLTKLSADTSSLRNTDLETAFTKLKAGIVGEAEPLREWGIDITEATLKQTALANGITKSYYAMTYGEKAILRYAAILRQTSKDQQDFANTLESPAQILRQLGQQFTALGRAIGNLLLPAVYKILTPLLAIVMVLKEIAEWLTVFLGLKLPFSDTSANTAVNNATGMSEALGDAVKNAKELKKWLGGYDELNNVSPSTSKASGAGTSAGLGIDSQFLDLIKTYDNRMGSISNKAAEIRDNVMKWLGFTKLVNDETGEITYKLQDGYTNIEKIKDALIIVGGVLGGTFVAGKIGGFITGLASIGGTLGGLTGGFAGLSKAIEGIGIAFTSAGVFSEVPFALASLAQGFASITSGAATFSEAFAVFIGPALQALLPVIGAITLTLSGVIVAFQGIADIIAGETFQGIMEVIGGIALIVSGVAIAFGAWPVAIGAAIVALLALGTTFTDVWQTYIEPIKLAFTEAIENVKSILTNLWETVLKPIVDNLVTTLSWLWDNALKPLFENISLLVGELILLILDLWNNILAPLINFIVDVFGPMFATIFNTVVDVVGTAIKVVAGIINSLVDVIKGIIKIIRGLINLDFKLALEGIWDIVKGVLNFVISIVEGVANLIINGINGLISLVFSGIKGFVNGLLDVVNTVLEAIDKEPIKKMKGDGPKIKSVAFDRFEAGGMPAIGSLFFAGEGNSAELVGNVGGRTNVINEAQLENALYRAMIKANKEQSQTPITNEVYIGGNKTDTILEKRRVRKDNIMGVA